MSIVVMLSTVIDKVVPHCLPSPLGMNAVHHYAIIFPATVRFASQKDQRYYNCTPCMYVSTNAGTLSVLV
jgi:hypothetical protein